MRFASGRSIGTRLIVILLLVLVVGQGIGAWLFISSIRRGFMDSLHTRMQRQGKQAAGILAEATVTYSTSLIESYIAEALKDQDIVAIRIIDRNGAIFKEQATPHEAGELFTVTEPLLFVGEIVGKVQVEYAARTIDLSMRQSLILIPLYQGMLLLVVAIVLIKLFAAYVKRPVDALNRSIDRITGGDLTTEVPIWRDDEISTIAQGVKFLAERLAGTITRIDSISEKVASAVDHLTATFDRVREVINHQNRSTAEVSIEVRTACDGQEQILTHTEQLLSLSDDNLSTLLEMRASSEEIAGTTDSLTLNLKNAYTTLAELARSAAEVTRMANEVDTFVVASSSSMEEIYRSVKHVEEMINESARLSDQTTSISGKGVEAVGVVMEKMEQIGTAIDAHMTAIERLGERSQHIDMILGVIEEVTTKSRLLSFNAQILASQAGEHGKGFAVVAEQIKQLSDAAAASTHEIAAIVSAIQEEIGTVVNDSRESVTVVRSGAEVVQNTAGVLDEILATARQATDLARNIERASREQTRGIELVVTSTEQIRERIGNVNHATSEQEKSTSFLLQTLHPIREGMELTRSATGEQARCSISVAGNIEVANRKNSQIATASAEQQNLNQRVLVALHTVVAMGSATVGEVDGLVPQVTALREEIEALRTEMAAFRIGATAGAEI